uniref:Uncharacterized protein n=1 Tax=Octopus bimaculoides TaxID=37653 RepID=A0A0L8IAS0_OCTBM
MLPILNWEKVRSNSANERRQSDSTLHSTLRLARDLDVNVYKDLIKSKPNPRPHTASVDQKWHMVKMVKSDVQLANATWRRVTVKFINDMIPPDNLLYPGHLAKEKISEIDVHIYFEHLYANTCRENRQWKGGVLWSCIRVKNDWKRCLV